MVDVTVDVVDELVVVVLVDVVVAGLSEPPLEHAAAIPTTSITATQRTRPCSQSVPCDDAHGLAPQAALDDSYSLALLTLCPPSFPRVCGGPHRS